MADINDLSLMSEMVVVSDDPSAAEQFFNPPLPDDGAHHVVLKMGRDGVRVRRQLGSGDAKDAAPEKRTGAGFLDLHIQLKAILATGEEGGTVCFDNVNSIVMERMGTSALHAMFALTGDPLPSRASLGELKDAVEQRMAQNPQVTVTTRWEAQEKVLGKYEDVAKGQKNFPPLPLGADGVQRYSAEVTNPKTGGTVRAQVRVVKYGRV